MKFQSFSIDNTLCAQIYHMALAHFEYVDSRSHQQLSLYEISFFCSIETETNSVEEHEGECIMTELVFSDELLL